MYFIRLFCVILIFLSFISCSKKIQDAPIINQNNLELQTIEAYREGLKELERGDALYAAKKFNEAEILFPQSAIAPQAALMAAYSYYSQNYYGDSIAELERFLKVYSNHKNAAYAEYLLGLCYYEQIVDEKKDLNSIENSKRIFLNIIEKYPETDFALDSEFKLDLIIDILASKEMYIGRYYFDKQKWIPAINRFKFVIDNYENTVYVEEALHRMVEIYYIIGLEQEARKYATLLGYNYKSSKWYEQSYSVFNKNYKTYRIKKENNSILKKLKSLFN